MHLLEIKINDSKIDMASVSPFLIWVLCVGLSAFLIVMFIKNGGFDWGLSGSMEGFGSGNTIRMTSCPTGTISYITDEGDTNCCDGDISDKQCRGTVACSLSPDPPGDLMSCPHWIQKEWNARSNRFCPPSMRYYYGTVDRLVNTEEGCSSSPNVPDGSRPQNGSMPKCKIYEKEENDYAKEDSCFNIKARDNMQPPTGSASKQIVPIRYYNGKKVPALLTASYMPPNGSSMTPQTCYDWNRAKLFLDSIDPSGVTTGYYAAMKDTWVLFCGASKAYYIDGTLSRKDAVGVH